MKRWKRNVLLESRKHIKYSRVINPYVGDRELILITDPLYELEEFAEVLTDNNRGFCSFKLTHTDVKTGEVCKVVLDQYHVWMLENE